jgi:hypothetical protein
MSTRRGSLVVVGTGYDGTSQVTFAAREEIEKADKVFYSAPGQTIKEWIEGINPAAESLDGFYEKGKVRWLTYGQMIERILREVQDGQRVCAAFYGHPGVFVYPSHEAIRVARAEGHAARMLPGISAEDCLFADLGVDPGEAGCQSYEATYFLLYRPPPDVCAPLLLWQIAGIGVQDFPTSYSKQGLAVLAGRLIDLYDSEHLVTLYEAPRASGRAPRIERLLLRKLASASPTTASTLYVPPLDRRSADPVIVEELGLDFDAARAAAAEAAQIYMPARPRGGDRRRRVLGWLPIRGRQASGGR